VQYCAKLALPGNGTLDTELVVYGTVVTVTCNRGFILPDGNLTRSVECVDRNNLIAWNDPIDDCQRKRQWFINVLHTILLSFSLEIHPLGPFNHFVVIESVKTEPSFHAFLFCISA